MRSPNRRITRRDLLKTGAAGLGAAVLAPAATALAADGVFCFHHDHVLGTSLDLHVVAPTAMAADAAERAALDEIERLRRIFSIYDPASELSRLNRSRKPVPISPELIELLRKYETWHRASSGAISARLGDLTRAWRTAEVNGEPPSDELLARLVADLESPGWRIDEPAGTVERIGEQPLDLNALGKAHIAERAAAAIRRAVPDVAGLFVNLGGDIVARGSAPGRTGWAVGIQDPFWHFDNAKPLAGLRLVDQAVAGSGGYQRYYTIDGERHSHILDPRTGRPVSGLAGATVVAADAITANALATALCVLSLTDGLRLVESLPGAEGLAVVANGLAMHTSGLRLFDVSPGRTYQIRDDGDAGKPAAWPAGFQVTVAVELPKLDAPRYRRPYTAVWVEDATGKAVRTLAVWGNAPKYLRDLSDWWKIGRSDGDLVRAVAKATRGPGKYDLVWDGKDDKGNPLPQGTYTVRVEVHREHGGHLRQSGKIDCRTEPAAVKLEKNAETAVTVVEFKQVEKK